MAVSLILWSVLARSLRGGGVMAHFFRNRPSSSSSLLPVDIDGWLAETSSSISWLIRSSLIDLSGSRRLGKIGPGRPAAVRAAMLLAR